MNTMRTKQKNRYRDIKTIVNPKQDQTILKGIDIEAEFLRIKQKTSTLPSQTRSLIVARVQYNEAMRMQKAEKDEASNGSSR